MSAAARNPETMLTRGWDDPESRGLEAYRSSGGYEGARRAFAELEPEAVAAAVAASGLRDRMAPDAPCAAGWAGLPKDGTPCLVVDAATREPGGFAARAILERAPHQVLEGALIAARATGSATIYLHVRRDLGRALRSIERAVDEACERGILGGSELGARVAVDATVHAGRALPARSGIGPAIEALEGSPPSSRPRPGPPRLFGRPVAVHGVEAIAQLPMILSRGAEWFRSSGPDGWPGARLVSVSGHVERPGVHEVAPGTPVREVIAGPAGGVWRGRSLKAVFPRGLSGPVLTARELELPSEVHASIPRDPAGASALIVLDDASDMAEVLWRAVCSWESAAREHCGPCRDGSASVRRIAARLRAGDGRPGDPDRIAAVCATLRDGPLCSDAPAATAAVESVLAKFRAELEAGIRGGTDSPGPRPAGPADGRPARSEEGAHHG